MSGDGTSGDGPGELVDAASFLELTERLRAAHRRLEGAGLPDGQRRRWRYRLVAITDTARSDLAAAELGLRRLEADLGRLTGG